jgi:hypothetical protein
MFLSVILLRIFELKSSENERERMREKDTHSRPKIVGVIPAKRQYIKSSSNLLQGHTCESIARIVCETSFGPGRLISSVRPSERECEEWKEFFV